MRAVHIISKQRGRSGFRLEKSFDFVHDFATVGIAVCQALVCNMAVLLRWMTPRVIAHLKQAAPAVMPTRHTISGQS